MKRKLVLYSGLIFCLLTAVSLCASESLTLYTFKDIEKHIEKTGEQYGAQNVLIVFDIDCTLLTAPDNFGSDLWYNWQANLLKKNKYSPDLVSTNFNKILFYQSVFQQLSWMYPTEGDIPAIISKLQEAGYKTLILTARGYVTRDLTERLLSDSGFNMEKSCFSKGFPGEYIPFRTDNPEKYGLTRSDVQKFKLQKARPVSFFNGMMMAAGQNKGIMLKTLLHKTGKKFKAIIFIDDSRKNIDNMKAAFSGDSSVNLYTYRYAFDDSVKRWFKESDKTDSIRKWKIFKKADDEIFHMK